MLIFLCILIVIAMLTNLLLVLFIYQETGAKKRTKAYTEGLQTALQLKDKTCEDLQNQIESLTWERDAAHMMLENVVKMVPEDATS